MLQGKTYLTNMNARATFSAKGQIVIPKDVRERYRFTNGQVVDVIETPEGVLLRAQTSEKASSFDEAFQRMRAAVDYRGPMLDEADWREGIADAIRQKWGDHRP